MIVLVAVVVITVAALAVCRRNINRAARADRGRGCRRGR